MADYLTQRSLHLSVQADSPSLLKDLETETMRHLLPGEVPVRFAVSESRDCEWYCDIGIHAGGSLPDSIFRFQGRSSEDATAFNVVMIVPTGIGASVGGHAGDATPAATLLASVCDTLITHPNVLNASDIIQVPLNALYVEGSLIAQLMMGTVGLRRVKNNRLLVLVQDCDDQMFTNAAINSVNAARASYGLNATIAVLNPRFRMVSEYAPSGVAGGRIEGIEHIFNLLESKAGKYDAVAITSVIDLPQNLHENYYRLSGEVVNPWGGIEAMLTHAVSLRYGTPSAHAPMLESRAISQTDFGVVDPRMAAEVISLAFLQCVLRGLQKSPAVTSGSQPTSENEIRSANVSCLVIPDGCVGLPTLAALFNGIPVVAVRGNTNLMRNDLDSLPWQPNQLFRVENYLEAAGVVAALRAGVAPSSIVRPLDPVSIEYSTKLDQAEASSVTTSRFSETGGSYDQ